MIWSQSGTATNPYLAHSSYARARTSLSRKGVAQPSLGIIGVGDCPLKGTPRQIRSQADQAGKPRPRAQSLEVSCSELVNVDFLGHRFTRNQHNDNCSE